MTNRRSTGLFGDLFQRVRMWLRDIGNRPRMLPDPLKMAAQSATAPAPLRTPPAPPTPDQDRDVRVAQRSRALAIRLFGANQPVENPRDLFGRAPELDLLSASVLDGGMHAVIYGPRGSGKTSLVRVFGDLADERGASVIYQSCAGGSDFGELMLPYLDDIGPASFGMREDDFAQAVAAVSATPTPRSLATLLVRADREDLILILDEFDRLEDAETKRQLAFLVKLLSDMRSRVRLVFVGISGDVGDLIDVHASVRRHLVPIGLSPLSDNEVENFIATTSRAIGLTFLPSALSLLRWLVCGSPYHMRLFSLHTCLHAIEHDQRSADDATVLAGLDRALQIWRGTNERDYALFGELVTRTAFPRAAVETIARLAALKLEFTADDVARALERADIPAEVLPPLIEALAPALGRLGADSSRMAFDDVLAPQFLLAMSGIARVTTRHDTPVPEGTLQ